MSVQQTIVPGELKIKKLHILGKIRIFNDYKTMNFNRILFFQNNSHVCQVFFLFLEALPEKRGIQDFYDKYQYLFSSK